RPTATAATMSLQRNAAAGEPLHWPMMPTNAATMRAAIAPRVRFMSGARNGYRLENSLELCSSRHALEDGLGREHDAMRHDPRRDALDVVRDDEVGAAQSRLDPRAACERKRRAARKPERKRTALP